MRLIKIIAICTSFFFLLNAEAQKPINKVLLKINREKTTVDDFLTSYNKNRSQQADLKSESIRNYLDLYINYRLKVIEAKALKMDTIGKLKNELHGYFKKLTDPYLIDKQIQEAQLHEAYQRSKLDVRASHILVKCRENASNEDSLKAYHRILEIKQMALDGKDFNELAKTHSDDLSARDQTDNRGKIIKKGNAGDLGYFTVFDMVYPFETAAYETPLGEIREPIRTRFGYHLLKPTDKHEAIGKVKVAHIFLSNQAKDNSEKNQGDKIFQIYQMLQKGSNFEKLAEQFSQDLNTRLKKGVLPVFGANDMVPAFYLSIFTIDSINGFSKPVKTPYGWHIIKLLERKNPGSFEEEMARLKVKIERDKRSKAAYLSYFEIVKKTAGIKKFDQAKNELFEQINSDLLKSTWQPKKDLKLNKLILKINKQNFTQEDFMKFIIANQQNKNAFSVLTFFEDLYANFVNKACEDYFYQNIEVFHPELKSLMDEYRDGILLFELSNQKVWEPSMNNEEGLKAYFQKHRHIYGDTELNEIKGIVISDYQDQLEQKWIKELRKKYPVKINKKILSKIINE